MFHLGLATSAYIEREVSYTVITNFFCSLLVLKSSLPWEILSCASQSDTKKKKTSWGSCVFWITSSLSWILVESIGAQLGWSRAKMVKETSTDHQPFIEYWFLLLFRKQLSLSPSNTWKEFMRKALSGQKIRKTLKTKLRILWHSIFHELHSGWKSSKKSHFSTLRDLTFACLCNAFLRFINTVFHEWVPHVIPDFWCS